MKEKITTRSIKISRYLKQLHTLQFPIKVSSIQINEIGVPVCNFKLSVFHFMLTVLTSKINFLHSCPSFCFLRLISGMTGTILTGL